MKYQLILLLSFFTIGGCSNDDEMPAPKTTEEASAPTEQAAPKKISDDNPFATQINALDTAKLVGKAAQESIDSSQQKLEDAAP